MLAFLPRTVSARDAGMNLCAPRSWATMPLRKGLVYAADAAVALRGRVSDRGLWWRPTAC